MALRLAGIELVDIALPDAAGRVDLVALYFYPGQRVRRALFRAAQRGTRVRLRLQGKVDYRFAALAAIRPSVVKAVDLFIRPSPPIGS